MNESELTAAWSALEPSARGRARIETQVFEWVDASETSLFGEWLGLLKVEPLAGSPTPRWVRCRCCCCRRSAGSRRSSSLDAAQAGAARYCAGSSSQPCSKCFSQFCAHGRPK